MALLDKIDALLVLMRHSRSKSEQDDVLVRLQAEVDRLHDVMREPRSSDNCPICGDVATPHQAGEVRHDYGHPS
jgi:hypothetical protein